jgi:hypothetical protein
MKRLKGRREEKDKKERLIEREVRNREERRRHVCYVIKDSSI